MDRITELLRAFALSHTTRMLLLIVVIALFSYLAVAFILWNTDLYSWGWFPRLAVVVVAVLWLTLSDYEPEDDEEADDE